MDEETIYQLIEKYLEGQTNLREEQTLRSYFERDDLPEDLRPYARLFRHTQAMQALEPSEEFDPFKKIEFEESRDNPAMYWLLRMAAGLLILLTGFAAGRFWQVESNSVSTAQNAKVQQMRKALMSTDDHEPPSAGHRLSAVQISQTLAPKNKTLDRQVADILIHTMDEDDNVNVRMAAAEALFKYRREINITSPLIRALDRQDNSLMQLTLIHLLVRLKAKEAVPEMQRLLSGARTSKFVRQQLKVGIAQLQT